MQCHDHLKPKKAFCITFVNHITSSFKDILTSIASMSFTKTFFTHLKQGLGVSRKNQIPKHFSGF